jgi:hypothetical protein
MVQSTIDKSSIHTLSRVTTCLHPQSGSATQNPVLIPSPQQSPLDILTPSLEKKLNNKQGTEKDTQQRGMVL